MSRVKLTVKPNKGKLNELYAKAHEEIDYITSVLDTFGRKFFTKDEFKMKLNQKYKKMSKSEVIANTYFDIVDPQNNCIKYSRTEESEKYQISNGNIRNLAESVLGRSSMFRRFTHDETEEYIQCTNESTFDSNETYYEIDYVNSPRLMNNGIIYNYSKIKSFDKNSTYLLRMKVKKMEGGILSDYITYNNFPFTCQIRKYTKVD